MAITTIQVTHEGVTTELYPLEQNPIRLNISAIENTDIGEVFGSLSQGFTIPGSPENSKFFNYLYSRVTTDAPGFNTTIPCFVKSGAEVLFEGELSLDEVVDHGGDVVYAVSIEDKTLTLNELLSGKKVIDLDPSGLLHDYSGFSALASWGKTGPVETVETQLGLQCGTWTFPANDEITSWGYTDCDGNMQTHELAANVSGSVTGLNSTIPLPSVYVEIDFGFGTPVEILFPVGGITATFSGGVDVTLDDANGDEALTSGRVFYPLIDQGTDGVIPDADFPYLSAFSSTQTPEEPNAGSWSNGTNALQIQQLTPATSVPILINKIFEQADPGITWESEFIDRFLGEAYIMPKSYDGLGIATGGEIQGTNGFNSGQLTGLATYTFDGTGGTDTEIRSRGRVTAFGSATNANYSNGIFTFPEAGTYELQFSMDVVNFNDSQLSGGASGQFHDIRFGIEIYNGATEITAGNLVDSAPIQFRIADDSSETIELGAWTATARVNAQAGWTAQVWREGYRNKGNADVSVTVTDSSFRSILEPLIWEGLTCNPLLQFDSDLLSIDLFKAILNKFNLLIVPSSRQQKHYEIVHYNDWTRIGTTRDWSGKLDRSQGISIKPLIAEQSKIINFVDVEEDDPFSVLSRNQSPRRELGSRIYPNDTDGDINTSKAEGTETIGEFFSPLVLAGFSASDQAQMPSDYDQYLPHLYTHNNGNKQNVAFSPKIGFRHNASPFFNASIQYNSGGSVVTELVGSYGTLSPATTLQGQSGDIRFSTNWSNSPDYPGDLSYYDGSGAYDAFWKDYVDNLYRTDNVKLTANFYFEPREFLDLRLNDPIYIDGQSYLINKVNGFNLSEPDTIEVELVRFYGNLPTFAEPNPDIGDQQISIASDVGDRQALIQVEEGDDVLLTATVIPSSLGNTWCKDEVEITGQTLRTLFLTDLIPSDGGVYVAKLPDGTESNTITIVVGDAAVSFLDEWIFEHYPDDEITQDGVIIDDNGPIISTSGLPTWLEVDNLGTAIARGDGFSDQPFTLSTIQNYIPGYPGAPANGTDLSGMGNSRTETFQVESSTGVTGGVRVTQALGPHVHEINSPQLLNVSGTVLRLFGRVGNVGYSAEDIRNGEQIGSIPLNPRWEVFSSSPAGAISTSDLLYNTQLFGGGTIGSFAPYSGQVITDPGVNLAALNNISSQQVTYVLRLINDDFPLNFIDKAFVSQPGTATLTLDHFSTTVGVGAGSHDLGVLAFGRDRWTHQILFGGDFVTLNRIDDGNVTLDYTENLGTTGRLARIRFTHLDNSNLTVDFDLTQSDAFDISTTPSFVNVNHEAGSTTFVLNVEGGSETGVLHLDGVTYSNGDTITINYTANTGPARTLEYVLNHTADANLQTIFRINQSEGDQQLIWADDNIDVAYHEDGAINTTYQTLPVNARLNVNTLESSESWLTFPFPNTAGNTSVRFGVETNNTLVDRIATVTGYHLDNSSVSDTFTVTQAAYEPFDIGDFVVELEDYGLGDNGAAVGDGLIIPNGPVEGIGDITLTWDCDWLVFNDLSLPESNGAFVRQSGQRINQFGSERIIVRVVAEHNTGAARSCIVTVNHPFGDAYDGTITVNQESGLNEVPNIDRYLAGYEQAPLDDLEFQLDLSNADAADVTSVEFQYGIGNFNSTIAGTTVDIGQVREYVADVVAPPEGLYQTRAFITYANGTETTQTVTVDVVHA